MVALDPGIIYFTHSRIRPIFTGCTIKVLDTVSDIRTGKTKIKGMYFLTVLHID
jgi:hypothetical protein